MSSTNNSKTKTKAKRRYGVMYYKQGGRWHDPDTWGSTEYLVNAYGLAARHVARSDLRADEYRKAVIYDRWHGRIVRAYNRTQEGISIRDY